MPYLCRPAYMGLHVKLKYKDRPFVMAQYVSYPNRKNMFPSNIKCPHQKEDKIVNCLIVFKGYRERKTGHLHPLAQFYCKIHNVYFTVYPIGHVPYGRAPLWDKNACDSLFKAAFDASKSITWPLESTKELPTFKTQKRHIKGAALLLKIDSSTELTADIAESLYSEYGIPYLTLKSVRSRDGPDTYKKAGEQVQKIISLQSCFQLKKILALGKAARFFGNCQFVHGGVETIYR